MTALSLIATVAAFVAALGTWRSARRLAADVVHLRGDLAQANASITSLTAERDRLQADLTDALGPHCPGCGNPIDPDTCGCGSPIEDHREGDGHGAVPLGCDCLRADHAPDWKRIAGARHLVAGRLWRERDAQSARADELARRVSVLEQQLGAVDHHAATAAGAERQ